MKPTVRSLVILTATLVIGMLLGALIHARFFDNRVERMHRVSTPEGFVESYLERIQPTSAEQELAIRTIVYKNAEIVIGLFREGREKVRGQLDAMSKELEPLLNEEQRERLAERIKHRSRRDDRKEEAVPHK